MPGTGLANGEVFAFELLPGAITNVLIFALLLYLPAGTVHCWRAQVFVGLAGLGTIATIVSLLRHGRDALNERLKPPLQQWQPRADKILVMGTVLSIFAIIVLIGLHVFRLHLMRKPGAIVSAAGLLVLAVAVVGYLARAA